ncbi:MAG: DUF1634 domain-containing protein [Candidatus Micrarchaeota archaeon]
MESELMLESKVGRILRLGLAAAFFLSLSGYALMNLNLFSGGAEVGNDIAMAGIVVLLIAPAASVFAMLLHYQKRKDRDFTLIALSVIILMALGYVVGHV